MKKLCKECKNVLLESDFLDSHDAYECSKCSYQNTSLDIIYDIPQITNGIYFKVNSTDATIVAEYLTDNNIEFGVYTNALKALCDEEVERLREEYIQIELTDEQTKELSETVFDTEMDLLNYDTFLELTDRYIDSINCSEE